MKTPSASPWAAASALFLLIGAAGAHASVVQGKEKNKINPDAATDTQTTDPPSVVSEDSEAATDSAPALGAVGDTTGGFWMMFMRHAAPNTDNSGESNSRNRDGRRSPAPSPTDSTTPVVPAPAGPPVPPSIVATLTEVDNTMRSNNTPAGGAVVAPQLQEVVDYARAVLPPPAAAALTVDMARELNRVVDGKEPKASKRIETWMNAVIEADADNAGALNERAAARQGQGNFAGAVDDASRVIERKPDDERAYTTRALANYELHNYAEALEDAKRALALNANNQLAHQISKLSQGRVTTAEELGLDSMQAASAARIADEYADMQRQRNQVEETTLAQGPAAQGDRVLDSLNQRAQNHIKMGDFQSAISISNKVLTRDSENVTALYTRAAAENLMGNYEHAVEDATAVLHRDPRHQPALDTRAQALLRLKRYQEAVPDADASIALSQKNAYAYMNRAKAKEQLGDIAGMIADYKAAARLSPQFADELREVARKYGIPLEAMERELTPVAAKPAGKARSFAVILLSSISGGLLIALGLLHILSPRRKRSSAVQGAGPDTAQALLGAGLAGYKQLRVLGQGGMGVVYEALDKALDRRVAIKRMREEIRLAPEQRERFLQEARIVAKLSHPNIVNIHQIVEDGDELYMIFEYVRGSTVDALIANKKRLSVKEAKFILRGVCHALAYAHAKGVIHRDLKPANIMVTDEGMVKVMDFGIARQAADAMAASTHTQTVAGTPQYMAPEQDQGEVRKESDLFALTACFYEMITGSRPFPAPATTASKVNKQYERPSRIASGISPELDAFIDAGLEPDPEKRIRTAEDFLRRLDAV